MKPENLEDRNRKIRYFVACYLVLLSVLILVFYSTFSVVPNAYQRQTNLTNEQMHDFFSTTTEADSLIVKMQRIQMMTPGSMVSFYQWVDKLEIRYKQPFFQTILKSYALRAREIDDAKKTDTTIITLKKQLEQLKTENTKLEDDKQALSQKLQQTP